jgi:hypothetical protein
MKLFEDIYQSTLQESEHLEESKASVAAIIIGLAATIGAGVGIHKMSFKIEDILHNCPDPICQSYNARSIEEVLFNSEKANDVQGNRNFKKTINHYTGHHLPSQAVDVTVNSK